MDSVCVLTFIPVPGGARIRFFFFLTNRSVFRDSPCMDKMQVSPTPGRGPSEPKRGSKAKPLSAPYRARSVHAVRDPGGRGNSTSTR